jgi:heme-degrading monooxygenase HmoA
MIKQRNEQMAVIMTSEVAGQTIEGYDRLFNTVSPALKQAQGFVMHVSHPVDGGWRVVEIWQSREDAGRFFATAIAPHLPAGIHPKLTFEPLHDVLHP